MRRLVFLIGMLFLIPIILNAENYSSQEDKPPKIVFCSSLGSSIVFSHVNLNNLSGMGMGPELNFGFRHLFF